jgi:hypothetical protein
LRSSVRPQQAVHLERALPRVREAAAVEAQAAAAAASRLGHRQLGALQQLLGRRPVRGRHGDAEAGRGVDLGLVHRERQSQRVEHGLRDRGDLVGRANRAHHHAERVAADARDGGRRHARAARVQEVAVVKAGAEALGDLHQHLAAAQPAVGAVDQLEAVEVEVQHGERAAPSPRCRASADSSTCSNARRCGRPVSGSSGDAGSPWLAVRLRSRRLSSSERVDCSSRAFR